MSREEEESQWAFPVWNSVSLCAVVAGSAVVHLQNQPAWGSERDPDSRALVLFHLVNSVTLGRLSASQSLFWVGWE